MKTSSALVIAIVIALGIFGGYYTYGQMTKPSSPTGEVILVVTGKITRTNVQGEYGFDLSMLEKMIDTSFDWECPWFGVYRWDGISLTTFLKEVGASEDATSLKFIASDGVTAEFPIAMLRDHPNIMLALKINGTYIPNEKVGPLRVVVPYDQYPELEKDYPAFPYTVGWIIRAEVG